MRLRIGVFLEFFVPRTSFASTSDPMSKTLSMTALFLLAASSLRGADAPPFLSYVRERAKSLQAKPFGPKSLEEWKRERAQIRAGLARSWGSFPETPCALDAKKLGEIDRDGFRIEKIVFQTLPDVWMTANAYIPDGDGKFPAVLCVHGHWSGAKQDPVVQARCVGLAKLGFLVLVVDAFGAGERGIRTPLGEYHGELTAATLIPTGKILAGLQVYENSRAVDYLSTRPEVDTSRIGITGASGGGNQTMYAGAWDERFRCVVPTCSVGNYQAYLGVACCLCETVPGALTYTEEQGVLGLVAPRGLMVINATRDGIQFSHTEARKSIAGAKKVFQLFDAEASIRHTVIESGHHYNQPMRQAMYGWMTKHLKGEGDGSPIAEPKIETLDREKLRCYPEDSRPKEWMTIPRFAAREGRRLVAKIARAASPDEARRSNAARLAALRDRVFRKPYSPDSTPFEQPQTQGNTTIFALESEPGAPIRVRVDRGKPEKTVVVLHSEGLEKAVSSEIVRELRLRDTTVVTIDLRATGKTAHPRDRIGSATDHNSAQWSLWTGRTLLEQWVWDLRRAIDVVSKHSPKLTEDLAVLGIETMGPVALFAAALDDRIHSVATRGSLASFISEKRYVKQRIGILVPGILRDVGDVEHIAALIAPRPLLVEGAVTGSGEALDQEALANSYGFAKETYQLLGAESSLSLRTKISDKDLVATILESVASE